MRAAMLGLAGLLSLANPSLGGVLTTEGEIRHAIIGNTISGVDDGKPYSNPIASITHPTATSTGESRKGRMWATGG
jgi:hypothetical protein